VNGLRCTAAATCLAVGAAGIYSLIATEKNGIWGKSRLVAGDDLGSTLTAVSCRSAGNCLVTGSINLGMFDDYPMGNESFGIAEINGIWGPIKFLKVAGNPTTDSAVQSCDRNADCAVGGDITTGSYYQNDPPSSAYVASYAP
jgi:hypothetical protein